MDTKDGGHSSDAQQRQTAAAIARKKVLAAYADPTSQANSANTKSHLKDEPIPSKINPESWQRYHSAWQNYYQKYYSEYYSKAAKDYVAKERLKDAREKAEEEELLGSIAKSSAKINHTSGLSLGTGAIVSSTEPEASAYQATANDDILSRLKIKIRKKATENVKKTRRYKRLIPIAAGIFVVLLILFLQYNRLIFAPIMAYVSPGNAPASEIEAIDPTITQTVSADPRLLIPKLNIDVPIHFGIPVSEVMSAMNNGVAHYRIAGASAYPGEIGNLVITGHSAGDVYSSNPYKYIFSGLERLEDGDLIYVNYNSVRYTYRVVKKEVVEPSNVAALVVDTDKPLLTLVTCTPLGTSRYRLLVTAEQISPNYDTSTETVQVAPSAGAPEEPLPSNEPSFFEGIWNWLTGQ